MTRGRDPAAHLDAIESLEYFTAREGHGELPGATAMSRAPQPPHLILKNGIDCGRRMTTGADRPQVD